VRDVNDSNIVSASQRLYPSDNIFSMVRYNRNKWGVRQCHGGCFSRRGSRCGGLLRAGRNLNLLRVALYLSRGPFPSAPLVTDVHYADKESSGTRYNRESLANSGNA